jgi:hypothetical protein
MRITLSKPVFAGLIGIILLPWVIIGIIMFCHPGTVGLRQNAAAGDTAQVGKANSFHEESVGPWGVLEMERMIIDLPSSLNDYDFDPEPYRKWVFKDTTVSGVRNVLLMAGVAGKDVDAILKTASENAGARQITVRPPDDIVRGFPTAVRAALYRELSHDPENIAQAEPFRFRGDTIEEWFVDSDIPAKTIDVMRPLIYKRGNYLLFSDPQLVLPRMASRYERLKLFGILHRTSTLRLTLRARSEQEEASIVDYWGYPDRRNEIEPLLTAVATKSDGMSIMSFLPVFARTHLYTYVSLAQANDGLKRDCHWASFNFFNDPPDNRFAVKGNISSILPAEYDPVKGPTRLGDIILFFNGDLLIHSCVYIADDVVFTKNGGGTGVPFIIEKLDDVVSYYQEQWGSVRVAFCRKKTNMPAANQPVPHE